MSSTKYNTEVLVLHIHRAFKIVSILLPLSVAASSISLVTPPPHHGSL